MLTQKLLNNNSVCHFHRYHYIISVTCEQKCNFTQIMNKTMQYSKYMWEGYGKQGIKLELKNFTDNTNFVEYWS